MAKNEKSHNAPSCPTTRYAIGTSEFVGRCNPRFKSKVTFVPGPKSQTEKKEGKKLTGARKVLNGGKGFNLPYSKDTAKNYHDSRGLMDPKATLRMKGVAAFEDAMLREESMDKTGTTMNQGDCTDNPFARLLDK